jgi:prepilin-type N-terminal cleavage/methylation domain-containing protein/prepilin-type processing-associated H-X9-DG protein
MSILRHPQSTRRQKSAFTLIELLVVIAIIAILAAILFPVFAQAREKARATSCLSNQKQLELGMLQYLQDFDETFPPTTTEREGIQANINSPATALVYSIRGRLASYVSGSTNTNKGSSVWGCLSAAQWPAQATSGTPGTGVVYWANDYGFNINEHVIGTAGTGVSAASDAFFSANPTFGFSQNVVLATIQSPAKFLILSDAARADGQVGRGSLTPQYIDPNNSTSTLTWSDSGWTPTNSQAAIASRHQGGFNAGYSDGHVKFRKPNQGPLSVWRTLADNDFRTDPSGG